MRPERTGQNPSLLLFAVNLICDNVGRYVLSDIQMNGSFTAELSIVAGFLSPVSGFNVAPSPGPKRRHLFLALCSYCPAFTLRRSGSGIKTPFWSSLFRLLLHPESLRTSAEGNGRFPLISLLFEKSKVSPQIYNGVREPRRLKTGPDNLFWGVDEGKQDPNGSVCCNKGSFNSQRMCFHPSLPWSRCVSSSRE